MSSAPLALCPLAQVLEESKFFCKVRLAPGKKKGRKEYSKQYFSSNI